MKPPYDREAEMYLLGAVLLKPDILPSVKQTVSDIDFFTEIYRDIYHALSAKCFDPVSICDHLKGKRDKKETIQTITQIIGDVSMSAGWMNHAKIVKNNSLLRQWMSLGSYLHDQVSNPDADPDLIASEVKAAIRDIEAELETGYLDMKRVVDDTLKDIEARTNHLPGVTEIKTGLNNLDEILGGYERGTTNYIIARPSIGKTAFALTIARNVAQKEPGTVLFFSLEMTYRALARRLLSTESEIHLSRLKSGNIYHTDDERLDQAAKSVSQANMIIVDHPKYREIERLIAATESIATQKSVSCVIIDHIQKTTSRKRYNSQNALYEYISGEVAALAKSINVPFIVLSQLSRKSEDRPEHERRPKLEDMRSTGAWEQDADTVIGLYRTRRDSRIIQVEGLKDRDGAAAGKRVYFDFEGSTQTITDTSKERAMMILEAEREDIKISKRGFEG
jgi:replicative DNA helicase